MIFPPDEVPFSFNDNLSFLAFLNNPHLSEFFLRRWIDSSSDHIPAVHRCLSDNSEKGTACQKRIGAMNREGYTYPLTKVNSANMLCFFIARLCPCHSHGVFAIFYRGGRLEG